MYESYYGFSGRPFQLSPDPRMFYGSRVHKRALAYLRYGIKQGEGFIIITGDVGTGKTTLVSRLFRMLESENVIAAQIVSTQIQADDLVRMVAAGFGLAYQRVTKAALLTSLEGYFRACAQEGKRVLLVVDEAQGLTRKTIEELRMLSNFQAGGRMLLQSFLLGQREFRQTLRSGNFEQLRQRVIAAYHLRPLDRDETRGYIEYRLQTVGWTGDPAIDDDVFEGIHHFTAGVPRRINTLFDRLLLFCYLEEVHRIDLPTLEAVTRDILEEHGGTSGEFDAVEPPPGPPAALPRGGRSASEPRRSSTDQAGADRLAAVEQSVASLADSVSQQLSLLREALMSAPPGERKSEDDDSN